MDSDDSVADRQWLRDANDRRPSPFPRLLSPSTSGGATARIEPSSISFVVLVSDYFEFARKHRLPIGSHEQDLDRQLLPLLFVYRHATELALKYAIAMLRRQIRQNEPTFECQIPEHHSLAALMDRASELFKQAKPYLDKMGNVEFLSEQAQRFIRELDQLDPRGEAFRYAHRKRGKTGELQPQLTRSVEVGVEILRAGMLHVEKELLWFIDMVEIAGDLYDEWTADMLADMGW